MSFGVAVSNGDEPFRYAAVFAQADSHLYSAKRAGRDRVHPAARRPVVAVSAFPRTSQGRGVAGRLPRSVITVLA